MEKMNVSCGALAYAYDEEGRLGIILGCEKGNWLPFKGCNKKGETDTQTASRELYEETGGLVYVDSKALQLLHIFETKRKEYRIALVHVDYNIIEKFNMLRKIEDRAEYMEKETLKFFPFDSNILESNDIHSITKSSIRYYWNTLLSLKNGKSPILGRKQAVSHQYACEHCTKQYVDKAIQTQDLPTEEPFPDRGKKRLFNDGRSSFLKQARPFNHKYTPSMEKQRELTREWRNTSNVAVSR